MAEIFRVNQAFRQNPANPTIEFFDCSVNFLNMHILPRIVKIIPLADSDDPQENLGVWFPLKRVKGSRVRIKGRNCVRLHADASMIRPGKYVAYPAKKFMRAKTTKKTTFEVVEPQTDSNQ